MLSDAESLDKSVIKLKTMDWPILLSPDIVSLETIVFTLRNQVDDKKGKVYSLCFHFSITCC